jgi:hypothetical protein
MTVMMSPTLNPKDNLVCEICKYVQGLAESRMRDSVGEGQGWRRLYTISLLYLSESLLSMA